VEIGDGAGLLSSLIPYAPTSPPGTTARFTWPGCRPCKEVNYLMMKLSHQ
jgi:hypothetical protein